jgi:hypothetical protein
VTDTPPLHGLLAPDETLLWEGRPDAMPYVAAAHVGSLLRGLLALAAFFYIVARLNYGFAPYLDVQLVVFGLFFLSIPIDIVRSALRRRWSRYALTERRAIVRTRWPLFGTLTRSYALNLTPVDLLQGRRLATIALTRPPRRFARPAVVPVFERIAGGAQVFALMTDAAGKIR